MYPGPVEMQGYYIDFNSSSITKNWFDVIAEVLIPIFIAQSISKINIYPIGCDSLAKSENLKPF